MVSTVSYVPVIVLVTTFVCWYVALIAIISPLFLQVTFVAGPPVEVQVRVLAVSLYTSVVAVGVPTTITVYTIRVHFIVVIKYFRCLRILIHMSLKSIEGRPADWS